MIRRKLGQSTAFPTPLHNFLLLKTDAEQIDFYQLYRKKENVNYIGTAL